MWSQPEEPGIKANRVAGVVEGLYEDRAGNRMVSIRLEWSGPPSRGRRVSFAEDSTSLSPLPPQEGASDEPGAV